MTHKEPKPGPLPKGSVDVHINLPRRLRDWAKRQPEGLSALLRRLLTDEWQKRRRATKERQGSDAS